MRKLSIYLISFLLCLPFLAKADEGMWLPMLVNRLNYTDMQKMGLQLTPEEIYSINNSSLKDAIVMINNGACSGFMVSQEGLMMTNHHCGFDYIQKHSTIENDYVDNGFWATNKNEELRNEKLAVSFLVRIDDVSAKIKNQLSDGMSEQERDSKIKMISESIVLEATNGNEYNAEVKPFFNGNEYYLFVYETYKDIRLVGAPPKTVGSFGEDSDNWLWPRHSGDFAFFRIYMSPQGKPAEYNKKNIPFVPKQSIPISLKGLQKDDFTMVMGYPGTTDRFITSFGVKLILEQTAPAIVNLREAKLKVIKDDMDASENVRIQYISKYNTSSNYWKYYIGQQEILKKLNALEKKQQQENEFTAWLNQDEKRKAKYGDVMKLLESAYQGISKYNLSKQYFNEAIKKGSEILSYSDDFDELLTELKSSSPNNDKIANIITSLKYKSSKYFKSYNLETDKKIFIATIQKYQQSIPKDQYPDILKYVDKKFKGDIAKWADDVFEKSIFTSIEKVQAFLEAPTAKVLEKDPALKAMESFQQKFKEIEETLAPYYHSLDKANRLYMSGIMEMENNKKLYPNANNTMRLTYGKVSEYNKADVIKGKYYTTIDELINRNDPKSPEFNLPQKFIDVCKSRDFGRYGTNGSLTTCFITDNDVTGGNSGAPILNKNGELVGIVFDINWEATASPIAFEPELQRTIGTDIRFILWFMEKYANAGNLVNEMKVVQ